MPETIFALLDFRDGKMPRQNLLAFLRERDLKAQHSLDSATFLHIEPDIVIEAFSDAKFMFVLRSCESWIVSLIDRFNLLFRMQRSNANSKDLRYLVRFANYFSPHLTGENLRDATALRKIGPLLVKDLAEFWHQKSVSTISAMFQLPRERRLIMNLQDLDSSIQRLAAFANVPLEMLNLQNTHANRDTHANETRKIIGTQVIALAARPAQIQLDKWLNQSTQK